MKMFTNNRIKQGKLVENNMYSMIMLGFGLFLSIALVLRLLTLRSSKRFVMP